MEVELKLALPSGGREALEAHPLFKAGAAETHHQRTTYFDTPDRKLSAAGMALRIRADGDRRCQTVKSAGKGGIAPVRGEWEWEVGQDTPDLARLASEPELAALASDLDGAELHPLFASEITRTLRQLRVEDSRVEAAIDEGVVRAGERTVPVNELELELKDGSVGPIYRLALDLHATVPFTLSSETKAARGYRLADGGGFQARKSPEISLGPEITAAEAFRTMVEAGIGQLLDNVPGVQAADMECTHQARVALRRLRTALVLFRPALEPAATARFNEELRGLGRTLGEARDWDVFCDELLPSVAEHTAEPRVLDLMATAAAEMRRLAHARTAASLGDERLTLLLLGMTSWVEEGTAAPKLLGDGHLGRPAANVFPALLDELAAKVHRRGRKIDRLTETELHALRKSCKKLRYAVEDAGSLYRHKRVDGYLDRLRELQELLGGFNDSVTGVTLACRLCENGRPDLAPGLAAVGRWAEKRETKVRKRLHDAFQHIDGARPFWN